MDSKAEYQLSNALALDKKYKKLFIEKGAFDDEVEKYRNILRNSFEQIFIIDLNYAVSNDIESSLWRNIFYLVIDDFRKRNKEYKKLYSTLNQNDKFIFKVYSSSFHSFIKESISFYTDFIQKLTKLYNLAQVSKVFKPIELSFINSNIGKYKYM
ncbi:hypothetical protein H8356DRAFT_932356 [Neocallimastix lanati (nom. inval.)]|nr:hypothetical protein H8356DRAFT_932356 [Neocallimastix sp. JGI-2020a]